MVGDAWFEDITNTLTVAALGLEFDRTQDQLMALGQRKIAQLAVNANALLNGTTLIDDLGSGAKLDLTQVQCPVLGVFGAESELIGAAAELHERIPSCRLHIVSGLGHTVSAGSDGRTARRAAGLVAVMSRFLFVVPPLTGHVNPTASVGGELLARGHEVAWVGHPGTLKPLLPDDARGLPGDRRRAGGGHPRETGALARVARDGGAQVLLGGVPDPARARDGSRCLRRGPGLSART